MFLRWRVLFVFMNRGVFYGAVVVLFVAMLFLAEYDSYFARLQPDESVVVPICPPPAEKEIAKEERGSIGIPELKRRMKAVGVNTISGFAAISSGNRNYIEELNSKCASEVAVTRGEILTMWAGEECAGLCGTCYNILRSYPKDKNVLETEIADSGDCIYSIKLVFICICSISRPEYSDSAQGFENSGLSSSDAASD